MPKFPNAVIPNTYEENVISAIVKARRALKDAGASEEEIDAFCAAVEVSKDYDEVHEIVARWVTVE